MRVAPNSGGSGAQTSASGAKKRKGLQCGVDGGEDRRHEHQRQLRAPPAHTGSVTWHARTSRPHHIGGSTPPIRHRSVRDRPSRMHLPRSIAVVGARAPRADGLVPAPDVRRRLPAPFSSPPAPSLHHLLHKHGNGFRPILHGRVVGRRYPRVRGLAASARLHASGRPAFAVRLEQSVRIDFEAR